MDDVDLTPLGLSPTATAVLSHVLGHGARSVSRLALETGIADSVVSRAVRLLEERGLVTRRWGRSAPVTIAAGVDGVLRAEAETLRETAERRADAIEGVAARLAAVAPSRDAEGRSYWLVPLSADGPAQEAEVRTVFERLDACVPRGSRPRGLQWRGRPGAVVTWRVLVEDAGQAPRHEPPRSRLEVRRAPHSLPWLEVVDGNRCAVRPEIDGGARTAWCGWGPLVALAQSGFDAWWEQAEPVRRDLPTGRA